jgi:hypothetical protein
LFTKNFFFSSYKEKLVVQRGRCDVFSRKDAKFNTKAAKVFFAALLSYFALRETS